MPKSRLFTPGPTMVSPEAMIEMAYPLEHHRTAFFKEMYEECVDLLAYVFQTSTKPLILTGSGTLGMESAILGCCKPDTLTLVCHAGKFGERWRDVLKRFNLPAVEYPQDWGVGFKAEGVTQKLDENPKVKTVIVVHSETSACAVSQLQEIAAVCRKRDVLLIVDGITAIGAIPFKMDEWGVDVAVTGSQKALMLPPGLAMVAVSDRAWNVIESHQPPTYYASLRAYRKSQKGSDTPYTPNNQMMRGLRYTLQQIRKEDIENVWKRSAKLAGGTRAAAIALGLGVFAKDPVDSVTGINVPAGIDEKQWRKSLRSDYGCNVAGGQDHLDGKMIRVSHMGYVDEVDTIGLIAALEWTLAAQRHQFELGSGTTAFLKATR